MLLLFLLIWPEIELHTKTQFWFRSWVSNLLVSSIDLPTLPAIITPIWPCSLTTVTWRSRAQKRRQKRKTSRATEPPRKVDGGLKKDACRLLAAAVLAIGVAISPISVRNLKHNFGIGRFFFKTSQNKKSLCESVWIGILYTHMFFLHLHILRTFPVVGFFSILPTVLQLEETTANAYVVVTPCFAEGFQGEFFYWHLGSDRLSNSGGGTSLG